MFEISFFDATKNKNYYTNQNFFPNDLIISVVSNSLPPVFSVFGSNCSLVAPVVQQLRFGSQSWKFQMEIDKSPQGERAYLNFKFQTNEHSIFSILKTTPLGRGCRFSTNNNHYVVLQHVSFLHMNFVAKVQLKATCISHKMVLKSKKGV